MTYYDAAYTGLPDPEMDSQFYDKVPTRRLVAWVFDGIITFGITFLIGIFTIGLGFLAFPLVWLLVGLIYRWSSISAKSSTWGMRMVGIEFRDKHGEKFSSGLALSHTLIFTIGTGFFLVQIVSIVLILTSRYGQSVQDMILGTTAVNRL
ncbi:MAG: RDD family protein [Paracoccaceae bacterium]